MAVCPYCEPHAKGFVIEFTTSQDYKQALSVLGVPNRRWSTLGGQRLFIEAPLLYGLKPYWDEFESPFDWSVFTAEVDQSGIPSVLDQTTWQAVSEAEPSFWIREIVKADGIRMMMQPIMHLSQSAQRPAAYEMLARAVNLDGAPISPPDLFAAAKEQEQLYLLDKSCRVAGIRAAGAIESDLLVFINFIPTSIYVPEHCLQTTMQAARDVGLQADRVVFEVVETERVDDLAHLKRILEFYRSRGFRYALDDVGQGFNDVSTLLALEPDFVKLDRAYVQDIHLDAEKRRIAQSVAAAAAKVCAVPLAEGIESAAEADVLLQLGYEWQQGYYYGRPGWEPVNDIRSRH